MVEIGLYPTTGAPSSTHKGEKYEDVLSSFDGLCVASPEEVRSLDGSVIGHDSHSRHEDLAEARAEVAVMLARIKKKSEMPK